MRSSGRTPSGRSLFLLGAFLRCTARMAPPRWGMKSSSSLVSSRNSCRARLRWLSTGGRWPRCAPVRGAVPAQRAAQRLQPSAASTPGRRCRTGRTPGCRPAAAACRCSRWCSPPPPGTACCSRLGSDVQIADHSTQFAALEAQLLWDDGSGPAGAALAPAIHTAQGQMLGMLTSSQTFCWGSPGDNGDVRRAVEAHSRRDQQVRCCGTGLQDPALH